MRNFPTTLALIVLWCAAPLAGAQTPLAYPKTRTVDQVDTYHGTRVADPYRWLEDDNAPETKAWVEAQNTLTFGWLDRISERTTLRKRLTDLWNFERVSVPFVRGGRLFQTRNNGLQNQSVLFVTVPGKPARVLLDPNTFSTDGTVALAGTSVSDDGKTLAYATSDGGSDWQRWQFLDIDTGKRLPDVLEDVKFSDVAWLPDGGGVYYGRYPAADAASKLTERNTFQKLYFHRMGTPQSQDRLVYERPDDGEMFVGGTVSDDGRYLVISVGRGTAPANMVYVQNLARPGSPIEPVVDRLESEYRFLGNKGSVLFFKTDAQALRGRIVSVDLERTPRVWTEVVPESANALENVGYVDARFLCAYLKDARSEVRIFDETGKPLRTVALPGIGSAFGFNGKRTDRFTYYGYSSFNAPTTVYRLDVRTGGSRVFHRPKVNLDVARHVVEQVFYRSKDGTRIPMFVVRRSDVKPTGDNPTLLYGYGGFSSSMTPFFNIAWAAWVEMGGVLAIPNLRGGAEYGEEWHLAGTKLRKQNVFDDCIAAARHLVAMGITKPAKLALGGDSNGGLLVGAVLNQQPELFGAALPGVGVMDMLRFHRFTIGSAWTSDYGSSDNPEEFKALFAYSPLHNIKPGTRYPAVLVTTADHDDRVVPAHSFKYAATLQAAQAGDAPILVRIETRAGHGAGKPTAKQIEQWVDTFGFLMRSLGMRPSG
ncbi:MAG: prolyl oligopeptidase family serine peptidase [Armatimonadota bacterium]